MIRKLLPFLLCLAAAGGALAQSAAPRVNPNTGQLVSPDNFWPANAQSIDAALGNVTFTANSALALAGAANSTASTAVQQGGNATLANLTVNGTATFGNATQFQADLGLGNASTINATGFGQTLMTTANATTARTTLQLGTMATANTTSYVPTSRTLTTSTGLTGGGNLTANRTLSVVFGTNATTVAAGSRGLPSGGNTSQILVKSSSADYAATWAEPRYAVFQIPIPHGSAFTDFELKGTETNFLVNPKIVFYYHSPAPADFGMWTVRPDVYWMDSGQTEKQWAAQTGNGSISDSLVAAAQVGGIIVVVKETADWCRSTNAGLVWAYSLFTDAAADTDASARQVWRPILPSWTLQVPNP